MRSTISLLTFIVFELLVLCMPTLAFCQQLFSIKGTVSKDFSGRELLLYKYKSAYDQELASRIDIINCTFTFKNVLVEPDAYLLKNPIDNKFFIFIWDADVTIDLTGSRFYEPAITGSPLTTELAQFNKINQDRYFHPIRKLDTLINQTSNKIILDSLQKVRMELMNWSKAASKAYRLKYYHDQADSFISLFQLTVSEDIFPIESEYQTAFEGLSDRLKKHPRARYYLDR